MATKTNEKKGVYIDITPAGENRTYKRLGEGVTNFTPSNNATIEKKHYINHKFATSTRNGIEKSWAISGDVYEGDPVNDYLLGLSEKLGSEVETTMLVVELNQGTETSGTVTYPAKKYAIMVDISNDGTVEGGSAVTFDGSLNAQGDPVTGTVTIAAGDVATFTATV